MHAGSPIAHSWIGTVARGKQEDTSLGSATAVSADAGSCSQQALLTRMPIIMTAVSVACGAWRKEEGNTPDFLPVLSFLHSVFTNGWGTSAVARRHSEPRANASDSQKVSPQAMEEKTINAKCPSISISVTHQALVYLAREQSQ
jgi:hypothetical protein